MLARWLALAPRSDSKSCFLLCECEAHIASYLTSYLLPPSLFCLTSFHRTWWWSNKLTKFLTGGNTEERRGNYDTLFCYSIKANPWDSSLFFISSGLELRCTVVTAVFEPPHSGVRRSDLGYWCVSKPSVSMSVYTLHWINAPSSFPKRYSLQD